MSREETEQDSMLDEHLGATPEAIREAREEFIKLGVKVARRLREAEFNEAQIVFANANARMELAAPGDDEVIQGSRGGEPSPACSVQKGLEER